MTRIYFKDGSYEDVVGESVTELGRIIKEKWGDEAYALYEDVLETVWADAYEDSRYSINPIYVRSVQHF